MNDSDISTDVTKEVTEILADDIDIFAWANNLTEHIKSIHVELFFFSKHFMPFRVPLTGECDRQLRGIFVDGILEYISKGVETGLSVRDFEEADKEPGVLQKTYSQNIEPLIQLMAWVNGKVDIVETFNPQNHDISKMKGVVARCSHPDLSEPFYLIKALPSSQVLNGPKAWMMSPNGVAPFNDQSAVKIPDDNQLLLIGHELFVFNQAKLKSLFGYDAKAAAVAQQKIDEIEQKFNLVFEEGKTLQSMVFGKASTVKKLQTVNVDKVSQGEIINHADDMGIEMMTDATGAIIIMDTKDLIKFVNLLNDDYIESRLTGERYEVVSKKPLKIPSDSDE